MTPTPCATCGYPINPGALHYANDRGSHHSTCGDPLGMKATAGRIAELEAALRPLAALAERPWHGCETALQSVNRDDAERAKQLLSK